MVNKVKNRIIAYATATVFLERWEIAASAIGIFALGVIVG